MNEPDENNKNSPQGEHAEAPPVERDPLLITEALNESTGFYIKAGRQIAGFRTKLQKLEIYDTPHYGRIFRLDGFNMTSEREEFVYHENLIHPALTAHPAPKKVLIIGGGDGGSAEEALKHPSVEQVTMCEIDAEVIAAAKEHFFAVHRGAFDNPKLRVHIGDGQKFIRDSHERFDLIALDLNDPMGPAEALYSTEFFQSCDAFDNQILPANRELLRYAARALRAPYRLPSGPDARGARIERGEAPLHRRLAHAEGLRR